MGQEQSRNSNEAFETRAVRERAAREELREALLRRHPKSKRLKALIDLHLPQSDNQSEN